MNTTLRWIRSSLLLILVLSIAGCGDSALAPTAPSGDTGGTEATGPEILMITDDESVRYLTVSADAVDGTGTSETSRALHVSAIIDGEQGGRLRCGRFVLAIPPGAFEGKGEISMTMPDSTLMVVDLGIDPVDLNDFKEPVKLCLLTDGTRLTESDLQIYWWDEKYEEWKGLSCDKDLSDDMAVIGSTEGLLTDLDHFSRYSGGKAGW